MSPVAQTAALVAAVVVAAALVVATVVLLRGARSRRERLDRELLTSRDLVAELSRRVAELSEEVTEARRAAAEDRDYVITSLAGATATGRDASAGDADDAAGASPAAAALLPYDDGRDRPHVGQVVEEQLVGVLARNRDASRLRARAVDVVVRTVALGHGVRRALSPEVLDRAAAEAHVARRRSRRERRRELKEARRLVRETRPDPDPDPGRGPRPGRHRREDAA